MSRVHKWIKLLREEDPLDAKCDFGIYKGWRWRRICHEDSDWILWLITDSKVLLSRELEKSLLGFIRNLTRG